MEAQPLLITLHDESEGYAITPARVPLAELRTFTKDVEEFLRGDSNDVDTTSLDVAIVEGSLGLRTPPIAAPGLLADLRRLASGELMDGLSPRRRAVMERWQKAARGPRHTRIVIETAHLDAAIRVDAKTDYRTDDADQWVRVERYVRGEIEDMGGHTKPNAHVRLPDGKTLVVDAPRDVLRDEKVNRLYKPAMLRIVADYNVLTREYRNAQLVAFVEHDHRFDVKDLERLTQRGAKAWRDVPDATAWIDALRGGDD